MDNSAEKGMEDLDTFKKGLIRSVTRLVLVEGLPYEKVWLKLKETTGRECGPLWERMYAITVKKLSRLLPADDCRARVGRGARMTVTDWLMFDLVLVHEKVDVIGAENPDVKNGDVPALRRLFDLVKKHQIEEYLSDREVDRVRRWSLLTLDYNTEGRECSPMLLQLRWYKMKERARQHFYEFWEAYRGNISNLEKNKSSTRWPQSLEIDIARMFSSVVTKPFPEWTELIQQKQVVLPEVFKRFARGYSDDPPLVYRDDLFITRSSLEAKPASSTNDDEPDLVLVEAKIDTITVDDDSDTEAGDNQPSTSSSCVPGNNEEQNRQHMDEDASFNAAVDAIMEEADGLSNVQILEATHVPTEELDDEPHEESDDAEPVEKPKTRTSKQDDANDDVIEEDHASESELNTMVTSELESDKSPKEIELVDRVLKEKLDALKGLEPAPAQEVDSDENDTLFTCETRASPEDNMQELVSKIKEELTETEERNEGVSSLVIGELPSNMEFIDDGIDFVEDSDEEGSSKTEAGTPSHVKTDEPELEQKTEEDQEEAQSKFDLKLMMLPVVYTTKVELMKSLPNFAFETVNTSGIIDSILEDSKPISTLTVKIEREVEKEAQTEEASDKNTSQDLIRLPTITGEEPQEIGEKEDCEDLITLAEIPKLEPEVKTPEEGSNELSKVPEEGSNELSKVPEEGSNELSKVPEDNASIEMEDDYESESSDDYIPDNKRVKITSSLFMKPTGRTYNPIKLCKNPDFNTRLRRLSAGFLTYESNRSYLNRLKPLTIDLHKSFERKLIDKTVYLVRDQNAPKTVKRRLITQKRTVLTSVIPTAMPAQSLIDGTKSIERSEVVDLIDEELAQRKNKVIELPDIVRVRRINQHLLTAEVSPMQVRNNQDPTTRYIEISPMKGYTDNNTGSEAIANAHINSIALFQQVVPQTQPSTLEDDNPLLAAPKAGETTRVKVELIDDDEEESHAKSAEALAAGSNNNEVENQSQSITAIDSTLGPKKVVRGRPPKPVNSAEELAPDSSNNQVEYEGQSTSTNDTMLAPKRGCYNRTPKTRPWYMGPCPVVGRGPIAKSTSNDPTETPWYQLNPFKKIESGLLTNDTLNKMIELIEGEVDGSYKKKKKKKSKPDDEKSAGEPSTSQDQSAAKDTPSGEKQDKDQEQLPQKTCKTRVRQPQNPTYCCWANRVMVITSRRHKGHSKKTWLPNHKCPPGRCVCCCVEEMNKERDKLNLLRFYDLDDPQICCWAAKMIKVFKERKKYESLKYLPVHGCLVEGMKECKCCCKQALDTVAGVVEKICQRVKDTDDFREAESAADLINKPLSETSLFRSVPAATVIDDGTVPYDSILSTRLKIPKTRGGPKSSHLNSARTYFHRKQTPMECNEPIDIDSNSDDSNIDRATHVTHLDRSKDITSQTANTSTESDQFIVLSDDETDGATTRKCLGNVPHILMAPGNDRKVSERLPEANADVPPNRRTPPKPKFIIKCFKNLINACPVRLGAKKILLTTANIPMDIVMPQSKFLPAVSPLQPSGLMTNVQLPKGVHLVLEPSGTLACAFEPDVVLDDKTLMELKTVVAIVQEQINNKIPPPLIKNAPIVNDADSVTVLSDEENSGDLNADPTTTESNAEVQATATASIAEPVAISGDNEACKAPETAEFVDENNVSKDDSLAPKETDSVSDSTSKSAETAEAQVISTKDKPASTENIADSTKLKIVDEATENIADATQLQTVDEAIENVAEDTQQKIVDEATENVADATQIQTVEKATENIADGKQQQTVHVATENVADCNQQQTLEGATDAIEPHDKPQSTDVETATNENTVYDNQNESLRKEPDSVATETTGPDHDAASEEAQDHSNVVSLQDNQDAGETEPTGVSNKKSILSDLMEMSGISSEDILPPVEEVAPPLVAPDDAPVELMQVTNVAALKYAVAQNAKFFRYALETGALAAIEVALQSTRRPRPQIQPPPMQQYVDLTNPPKRPKVLPPRKTIIKPVRGAKNPIIVKKVISKPHVMTITPPTVRDHRSVLKTQSYKITVEKAQPMRKQRKQLVDSTIYNLDATDGEMEEEYLLESEPEDKDDPEKTISHLKSLLAKERAKRTAEEAELSSDDEPLAQKVRRRARRALKKKVKKTKRQLRLIQREVETLVDRYSNDVSETGPEDGVPIPVGAVPIPEEIVPGEVIPGGDIPGVVIPGGVIPEGVINEGVIPGGVIPGGVIPGGVIPGEAILENDISEALPEAEWLDPSGDESDNFILGA